MEYSNQQIPEEINYSRTHPLKEFFLLTTGVVGTLLLFFVMLAIFADKMAHYIPFSIEKNMDFFVTASKWPDPELQTYLQNLADRISGDLELPEGMKISVHYDDSDVINAYATLGGNLVFYRGLLEKMTDENSLAMVMAHEIAHVRHRHPIRSLGKGIVIGIAVSLVNSSVGDSMIGNVVGGTGVVTLLKFTREHEEEADLTALESLNRIYGHVYGSGELFKIIKTESATKPDFELAFMKTHPDIESRIQRIENMVSQKESRDLTPLPESYFDWLSH